MKIPGFLDWQKRRDPWINSLMAMPNLTVAECIIACVFQRVLSTFQTNL